ncbi:MAG: hypothetical protein Fur0025_19870 [Oscillatoriaceae cyanobacterium]
MWGMPTSWMQIIVSLWQKQLLCSNLKWWNCCKFFQPFGPPKGTQEAPNSEGSGKTARGNAHLRFGYPPPESASLHLGKEKWEQLRDCSQSLID